MDPLKFREIDALAIEAERPAECREQETNADDTPALVTRRCLVIYLR